MPFSQGKGRGHTRTLVARLPGCRRLAIALDSQNSPQLKQLAVFNRRCLSALYLSPQRVLTYDHDLYQQLGRELCPIRLEAYGTKLGPCPAMEILPANNFH